MAFSPSIVGCLVKKGLQKGGSRAPQDPPCLRSCYQLVLYQTYAFCLPREAAPQFPWKLNFSFQCHNLNLQNLNFSNFKLSSHEYDRDFDPKSFDIYFEADIDVVCLHGNDSNCDTSFGTDSDSEFDTDTVLTKLC